MLVLLLGCLHRPPEATDSGAAFQARHAAAIATMWASVPPDAEIREHLGALVQIDQHVRRLSPDGVSPEDVPATRAWIASQIQETDARTTAAVSRIIEVHGWPRQSVFGRQAAHDAWLLVQHADQRPDFQAQVLSEMEALLGSGEVSASDYAYLYDRVETNAGRPQRYGTQGRCTGPGTWAPGPLEDAQGVDRARALVGLEPMAAYQARFVELCGGAPAQAEAPAGLPDPCGAVDVGALRAAGWSPGMHITLQTPDGAMPVLFETPEIFAAFLAECEPGPD